MAYKVKTSNNEILELEDKPFASGAEGDIHKIVSPSKYSNHCVKLYKDCIKPNTTKPDYLEKIATRHSKISFMVKYKPAKLQDATWMICWPVEIVNWMNGQFVGFIMPFAFKDSIELFHLTLPNLSKDTAPIWKKHNRNEWLKYDRTNGEGIKRRLQLNANLAIAIHSIHSVQKYVIVDLKPQNILVCPDGKISILDTDTIQISENGKVLFHSQMVTEDYLPPENLNPAQAQISLAWDRFILGVMFYEILFGLKPFEGGSFYPPYDNCSTVRERIKNGLFPFGSKANYFKVIAPQHQFLKQCPTSIQNLFIKAFDSGITNPESRPSTEDWGRTFYNEVKNFVPIVMPKIEPVKVTPQVQTQTQSTYTQTSTQKTYSSSSYLDYASFGSRLGAYLIDAIFFNIILFIANFALVYVLSEWFRIRKDETVMIWSIILNLILVYQYYIKPEASSWQGTIGKKIVGIKVTDLNGYQISKANAVGRYFGKLLSTIIILIGWLMPLWTDKKQALHDMVASTLVLKK